MTFLVSWLAFPVVLATLALGVGLLVAAVARIEVPRALLVPLGLAGAIVLAQPLTMFEPTAVLAMPLVVAGAVAGFAASVPWHRGVALDPWPLAVAAGVFTAFAAPFVLSGEPTFGGYLKLDDTASWLALTDRAMEYGTSAAGLPPSSYEATLDFYLGSQYPLGTFLPLGIGSRALAADPAWLYQPYVAFLAATLALTLYSLAGSALGSRPLRASAVFLASQPALLFAYGLWGGAKEVAAAWLLVLMSALVPLTLRHWGRTRAVLPLSVAGAATLAVLSSGGGVWVLPVLVLALIAAVRRHGAASAVKPATTFAMLLVVLSLPPLLNLRFLGAPAASTITEVDRLANLIQPLSLLQVFGVWPTGEFRLPPADLIATYTLVAIVAVAAVVGLVHAWRGQAWALLLLISAAVAGSGVVVVFGSAWVDAKALAIASPVIVLAAGVGAASLATSGRRFEGVVLAVAIAGGVLWSNVLAYREVNLAPRERLFELERTGENIAGQGPTLMTDYEPYGVRYFLRDADPEGASELRRRPVRLRGGGVVAKAQSADIDTFELDAVLAYRTLVLRRSPFASRPPAPYRLVSSGRYYQVWQRPEAGGSEVAGHLSLGDRRQAEGPASCEEIRELARGLGPSGLLTAMSGTPVIRVAVSRFQGPSPWPPSAREPDAVIPTGSGSARGTISLSRRGRYEIWLGGAFRGEVTVLVDGRPVSRSRHELSHGHPFLSMGAFDLDKGRHGVTLRYGGPSLHPGSAGRPFSLGPIVLTPQSSGGELTQVAASRYRELCQRRFDWIEGSSAQPRRERVRAGQ